MFRFPVEASTSFDKKSKASNAFSPLNTAAFLTIVAGITLSIIITTAIFLGCFVCPHPFCLNPFLYFSVDLPAVDPDYCCVKHGDGRHTMFASYRVDPDLKEVVAFVNAVENLPSSRQNYLTVFLDKHCLPIGEYWEEGFVNCLRSSEKIILVVSPEGVKRCENADTTVDNYLLEMDLATELSADNAVSVIPIFMVEKSYQGGHAAFLNLLKTGFPEIRAKHRWSRKTIAGKLRAVANLPGGFMIFRGDDFSETAEKIASQCASSKFVW